MQTRFNDIDMVNVYIFECTRSTFWSLCVKNRPTLKQLFAESLLICVFVKYGVKMPYLMMCTKSTSFMVLVCHFWSLTAFIPI